MATKVKVIKIGEASGAYRIQEPYENLKIEGIEFIFSDFLDENDIHDKDLKAVLIQRPAHPDLAEFMMDLKREGKIVVSEIDDDLLNLPASNLEFQTFKEKFPYIRECLKNSDYIHVSTPELAKRNGAKSVVFLNAINLKKYKGREPLIADCGWYGGVSHIESLQLIKEPIKELINSGVKVLLMGNLSWFKHIKMFNPHHNLFFMDWMKEDSHRAYSTVRVNLAPLNNTVFNQSKSELRILESAVWKVPTVSSDIAAYRRFNENSNGGNRLVKKERTKEWVKEIISLLRDESLYKECSEKSFNAVKTTYNLETVNEARKKWWCKVLKAENITKEFA